MNDFDKISFRVKEKNIDVYLSKNDNTPIVYYNSYTDNGDELCSLLKRELDIDFTFVFISNLDWNNDMSPWYAPPLFNNDAPYLGGADNYLAILLEKIVTEVEEHINNVSYRVLSGYSLAGLFSLYSVYNTNIFSRLGCFSSSFWFPQFKEYVLNNKISSSLEYAYFSIGDKESKTKNKYFKTTENNTREIEEHLSKCGVKTLFSLNSGNHHDNVPLRIKDGIKWLLK